jgi:metallophosphoesterase superfamily enzyme
MQKGREWIWVAGNHDPAPPEGLSGASLAEISFGAIHFRHLPFGGPGHGEIAGHLHPVARINGRAGSLRRRCFLSNGQRCVMPAFGAFTGGLNVRDEAFLPLFKDALPAEESCVHVLGKNKIYAISTKFCAPD